MRVSQKLAVVAGLILASAGSGFAQTDRARDTNRTVRSAESTSSQPSESPGELPAAQNRAGAVQPDDVSPASSRLIPTTAGPLGLFTLETGDTLGRHDWSV